MSDLPKFNTVLLEKNENILTIILNRPEVLNAFNDELGTDLLNAMKFAETDDDTRCIVITGARRAFSSGEDMKAHFANPRPLSVTLDKRYHPLVRKIRSIPKPVIARVNGVAAGAGLNLALICDLRIAADSSRFAMVFVNIGLVPDCGAMFLLPRLIGYGRTFEWMTTGDILSAEKALAWGLVNQVVPTDKLDEAVMTWAKAYASGPTKTYALIKRGINAAMDQTFEQSLNYEMWLQDLAGDTEDSREGVRAFNEKRPANYTGQ